MVEKNLFEELGGEEAVAKVVDYFYELVLEDDTVNHYFKDVDMVRQRAHQTKFISFALGGPNQYTGKAMAKVHEGMNKQPIHYDAIVKHLRNALLHFNVSEPDIETAIGKVETFRDDILYK